MGSAVVEIFFLESKEKYTHQCWNLGYINMELDLQSLFGLHGAQLYSLAETRLNQRWYDRDGIPLLLEGKK